MDPSALHSIQQPNGNQKIWAILSHLSVLLGLWIVIPLVVYLAMKDESEYVASNSRAALNFQISIFIYSAISAVLIIVAIGLVLLSIIGIAAIILAIMAAVKASNGETFKYPLTINFIK